MEMKWYRVSILLVLSSAFAMNAYQKMCYMRSQYGRVGSEDDLKQMMSKYVVNYVDYIVASCDERKICFVRLNNVDRARVKLILDNYDGSMEVTDSMIKQLLNSKREAARMAGLVLRDFKCKKHKITVEQVRCEIGISKK